MPVDDKRKSFVVVDEIVISPRMAKYLQQRGYSLWPIDSIDYTASIVNQVLARRRQHLEKRNDFIQIMVDHEEEVEHEESNDKQEQQSGTLKKSKNRYRFI